MSNAFESTLRYILNHYDPAKLQMYNFNQYIEDRMTEEMYIKIMEHVGTIMGEYACGVEGPIPSPIPYYTLSLEIDDPVAFGHIYESYRFYENKGQWFVDNLTED